MARMVDGKDVDEEVGMMAEHKERDGAGLDVFSEQVRCVIAFDRV